LFVNGNLNLNRIVVNNSFISVCGFRTWPSIVDENVSKRKPDTGSIFQGRNEHSKIERCAMIIHCTAGTLLGGKSIFQNPVDRRWNPDHAAMFAPHA
jgi:hypothetical protein